MEPDDSLDRFERYMAVEEVLTSEIQSDTSLTMAQRERLIQELRQRLERVWEEGGDFGDYDDDDDALAALVRKLDPRGPLGKSGIALTPEDTTGFPDQH